MNVQLNIHSSCMVLIIDICSTTEQARKLSVSELSVSTQLNLHHSALYILVLWVITVHLPELNSAAQQFWTD